MRDGIISVEFNFMIKNIMMHLINKHKIKLLVPARLS